MLRSRFAFTAFSTVLVMAAAAAWGLHSLNRNRAVEQYQDRELHSVEQIAAVLRAELTGSARLLHNVASRLERHPDATALAEALHSQMECPAPPCFSGLAMYDTAGVLVASAGDGVGLSPSQVHAALGRASDPANPLRTRYDIVTGSDPALVLSVPLAAQTGGRPVPAGIVSAQLRLDGLLTSERPASIGETLLVVDGRGDVIYRTGHPEMRLNNAFRPGQRCFSCHESFAHLARMRQLERGVLDYEFRGAPRLAAVTSFDVAGEKWMAALSAPAATPVSVLSSELRQLGLIMASTVLALGVTAQLVWRDSRRRVDEQAAAVRRAHFERSHAELTALNAKLESAAIEWRTTLDTIDAAVIVLDPSGHVERMNRAAADTLPGPPFSWLGERSERLAEYRPWDAALALAREAIGRGAASSGRVLDPASGHTWDLWCRTPRGRDGVHTVVIVARDVTALVQLQESLRRSETVAALGLVVAGVAHEVRNPLFAISSLVDAWSLQRHDDPAPLVDALHAEVARLKTLMTDLLEYGSPAKSVRRTQPLAPVIEQATRACAHEADARGVRITADVPPDLEVSMDAHRLLRVFINLVQNAAQHSPQGGEVHVGVAARSSSGVRIAVRDHGPGFAAEDLPRAFTPFFSRRAGGFGLGLAITERIVVEHDGTVDAANHPDGGAVLTVSLPLVVPDPAVPVFEGASSC